MEKIEKELVAIGCKYYLLLTILILVNPSVTI